MDSWLGRMDYLYFSCGLSFLILSIVAAVRGNRRHGPRRRFCEDLDLESRADALQVKQAVLNLVLNAAEAIEEKHKAGADSGDGGSITLATGVRDCDAEYLRHSRIEESPAPGRFVFVEVSDTGCGMDDDTKRRLFDPFFSTKFLGRGLGMPAVLGIVRSHNGALLVESRPGKGATVRLLFPVAKKQGM